jgi:hypothetical protein
MAPDASAVEVMSNSRRESFRFRMIWIPGFNGQSIGSFDHLVGDGKQRWRHPFDEKYALTDEWSG